MGSSWLIQAKPESALCVGSMQWALLSQEQVLELLHLALLCLLDDEPTATQVDKRLVIDCLLQALPSQ